MARCFRVVVGMAATAFALPLPGCGGGGSISDLNHSNSGAAVNGFVFKGRVSNGKVTAYRMDDAFRRGDALGSADTDGNGAFSLLLPAYSGHLLLVANSGTYMEEAIGVTAALDGTEMDTVIAGYVPGTTVDGVLISPVSHLVVVLANFWAQHEGKNVRNATEEAWVRLNGHFGGLDWRTVKPTDFNTAGSGVQIGDAGRAGLLLGALSQQTLSIANRAGVTAGSGFKTVELISALADDLRADGYFDGVGTNGSIVVPLGRQVASTGPTATRLDGHTMRLTLSFAMTEYLQNSRNHSGITFADAQNVITAISSNSDSRIFRQSGQVFDQTPPVLAFTAQPARYTNQLTATFQIRAADPESGVMAVYAQNGGQPAVEGERISGDAADGVYRFSLAVGIGLNTLTVWAVDRAGNSGRGRPAPSEISALVTRDNSPPIPTFVATPNFFSEQNLRVQVNGAGVPTVPPTFEVPTGEQKQTLLHGSVIWKTSTRLSWGTAAPSGAALENGTLNGPNTPFLQFLINYVPDTQAPITQVRYSISASCTGCPTFSPATGDLIPAARTGTQQLYFDLPLASETIPALTQMKTSPLNLTVTVSAMSAAGNSGMLQSPITLAFRVLGPPLAVIQDTSYPTANDARSVFPYRLATGTYHQSWAPNSAVTSDSTGQVNVIRVLRYLIRNPYRVAIPVANFRGQNPSWVVNEEWDEEVVPHYTTSFTFEGHTYYSEDRWQIWPLFAPYIPCDRMLHDQYYYIYPGYPYLTFYPCRSNPAPSAGTRPPGVYASSTDISLRAYKNPQPSGAERDVADSVIDDSGSTYFQVPAATGSTPGLLVVYVVRPFIPSRTSGVTGTLIWQTLEMPVSAAYRNYIQDFWALDREDYCLDVTTARCFISFAYRNARKLASANEVLSGRLDFATGTIRADGRVLTELNSFTSTALPYVLPH